MDSIIDPHKISFVLDEPSDEHKASVERMCHAGAESIVQYTTLPNHQMNWMEPPSGSVMVWKQKGPFCADPFYCDMFKATAIKEIDFTDRFLTGKEQLKLLQKMNQSLSLIHI